MNPKVSVVIPSLNRCSFIKKAIDSVLNQDYKNVELLVIDGASTDGTVDLLKSYGKRITWLSEKDKSLTEALNKGVKKASGDFFMTLATDEVLFKDSITRFVNTVHKTHSDIVIGQGYYSDDKGNITDEINNPPNLTFLDILTLRYKLPLAFSFFSMKLIKQHYFDEDFLVCQDFAFLLTTFEKSKIVFIQNRIGKFAKHDSSWSWSVKNAKKVLEARLNAHRKYFLVNQGKNKIIMKKCEVAAFLDYFELILPKHYFRAYFILLKQLYKFPAETVNLIKERSYRGRIINCVVFLYDKFFIFTH